MTLNITGVSLTGTHQCADFRLLEPGSRKVVFDAAAKMVVLQYPGWTALVSYNGLGRLAGRSVDDWIAATVRALKPDACTVEQLLELIRVNGDRLLAGAASNFGGKVPAHSFVVAAWVGGWALIALISNYERIGSAPLASPAPGLAITKATPKPGYLMITGLSNAVTRKDRELLKHALKTEDDPAELRRQFARVNARAAASPAAGGGISPGCWAYSLFPHGSVSGDNTGGGEYHGMPGGTFIPRSITNGVDLTDQVRQLVMRAARTGEWKLGHEALERGGSIGVRQSMIAQATPPTEAAHQEQLRARPNDPAVWSNYGAYRQDEYRDIAGAENAFRRALELDPNHADARANLAGFLWREHGDLDSAEEYYLQALRSSPKNSVIRIRYIQFLHEARHDLAGAERVCRAGLALNSSEPELVLAMADIRFLQGRYAESVALYDQ